VKAQTQAETGNAIAKVEGVHKLICIIYKMTNAKKAVGLEELVMRYSSIFLSIRI